MDLDHYLSHRSSEVPTYLNSFNQFMDLPCNSTLTKLRVEVDAGRFDPHSGGNIQVLRGILKGMASKKKQQLNGTCIATFTVVEGTSLPPASRKWTFSADCWSLRESLPQVSDSLTKAVQEAQGMDPKILQSCMHLSKLFVMWAKAAWAT